MSPTNPFAPYTLPSPEDPAWELKRHLYRSSHYWEIRCGSTTVKAHYERTKSGDYADVTINDVERFTGPDALAYVKALIHSAQTRANAREDREFKEKTQRRIDAQARAKSDLEAYANGRMKTENATVLAASQTRPSTFLEHIASMIANGEDPKATMVAVVDELRKERP